MRRQLRARRRQLPDDQRQSAANGAVTLLHDVLAWQRASRVACYLSTAEEFDCQPLLQAADAAGKQTFLPAVANDKTLRFLRYRQGDALQDDHYGIFQPVDSAAAISVAALDIMFMPLVGWHAKGVRLGMGAGYYDRALSAAKPRMLIGLGHDCQECNALPQDPWDVLLDYVLTGTRLVKCTGH